MSYISRKKDHDQKETRTRQDGFTSHEQLSAQDFSLKEKEDVSGKVHTVSTF
jgi:hypothetical protein